MTNPNRKEQRERAKQTKLKEQERAKQAKMKEQEEAKLDKQEELKHVERRNICGHLDLTAYNAHRRMDRKNFNLKYK